MKTPCLANQCLELSSSPATQDGQELRAHGQTDRSGSQPAWASSQLCRLLADSGASRFAFGASAFSSVKWG